jgi:anti-sigma factor RsiW
MSRLITAVLIAAVIELSAAGLTYTAPASWKPGATSSAMRVAQFSVPRSVGDAQDGELVVYYFGGAGGTIEANIDRWVAQMQQPDGRPSSAVAKRQSRTVNGLKVTLVDVPGTYIAEVTPGSTERHNSPNFHLRAAVIETSNGPYFIKLTGPAKTIAAAEKAFESFLSSVKFTP